MQLGRVFISSVFGGMLDLREVAAEAARLVGLEPVLTEHHVAQPGAVRDRLTREIAACDTYVGLFDRRLGTVPAGSDEDRPRAITEEEFKLAREQGLRCLVFLSRAAGADREPGLQDFLDGEVTEYRSGLWTRPYTDEASLRREIAAGLAALRPRVVLEIASAPEGRAARLHLRDVAPAWTRPDSVLGPVPVRLDLSPSARLVLIAFRRGADSRSLVKEGDILFLGEELGVLALPGGLGDALAGVLDLAASVSRLVTLEVRSADPAVLALPWELLGVARHPLPVREGLLEIVRRLPGPGASGDPLLDTAASLPADHLEVLGFTAAPVEDEAPTVRFGASGGFGSSELFWEQEQERLLLALEGLLRERRGRLHLPDTGEKEDLRLFLSQAERPQVVHISCHGSVQDARPVLFLEDADGRRSPLGAEELLAWSRSAPGGAPELALLVLAACSTAGTVGEGAAPPHHRGAVAEAGVAHEATGLAETLVAGGLLRVLGMQSTVSDAGATAFAEKFYARLADGADLSLALRAGRVELGAKGMPHEWAIPTLTTRCDAGPLVAPRGSAEPVEHPFEAARGTFDVAGVSYLEEGYVGRRDAERRLRRAFATDRLIAIHGLGGIGKSTLAARFLERRQADGWRVLILYAGRELAPSTVFEETAARLGLGRPSGVPAEVAEERLREGLKQALRAERTVLFLDNFEDNQEEADGALKNPALGEALWDLAELGGEDFRLLFTSRLAVELGEGPFEVRQIDLGELAPSGCRKLRSLPRYEGLRLLQEEPWKRVLSHLGGHPKALDLLNGYLQGKPDRVAQLLADLGPALEAVDAKLRARRQVQGRQLLVDRVLATVPDDRRPAFDRLCLLAVPLPTDELEALLTAEGLAAPAADLGWLRDHGCLARTVAPSALTGGDAIHRLLVGRHQEALAQREGEEAVKAWHLRVAEHLVQPGKPLSDFGIAAGHRDAAGDRAGALELYGKWARSLRGRYAHSACLQIAREGIERFPIGTDEAERLALAKLLLSAHDALTPLGQIAQAKRQLAAALELLGAAQGEEALFIRACTRLLVGRALAGEGKTGQAVSELNGALADFEAGNHLRERALTLGEVARLRAQTGDVSGALKLHEEILQIVEQLGDLKGRAVTLGDVARLRAQSGDVSGALKLHEERLQIFEQLGDVRSRAVTLGDVARLRAQAGDVSGALKLQLERLETNRRLGDVDGIAAAQYDLATLNLQQEKPAEALERLAESWDLFCRIGRADFLGYCGRLYGALLATTEPSRALEILRTSRDAFQLLGWTTEVDEVAALMRRIEHPEPPAVPWRPTLWQRVQGWLGRRPGR